MGNKLKPLTHEEAVERGRKGGLKFAENQKKRKAMKETIQMIMDLDIKDDKKSMLESFGIDTNDQTVQTAILVAMAIKALDGDLKAAEFLRDTAGEKPETKVNSKVDMNASETQVKIYLPDNNRDGNDQA